MFSTEDDPEGEQHGVEDSLTDVSKQQHPRPVESDGEPLYWDVDEGHGDAQCKDQPLHRQTSTQGSNTSSSSSSTTITKLLCYFFILMIIKSKNQLIQNN